MLDLDLPYENHGVRIEGDSIYTSRGKVRVPFGVRTMFILLLESYPAAVRYSSLISVAEEFSSEETADPMASLRAQLSKVRKGLDALGIVIVPTYSFGYKLVISI